MATGEAGNLDFLACLSEGEIAGLLLEGIGKTLAIDSKYFSDEVVFTNLYKESADLVKERIDRSVCLAVEFWDSQKQSLNIFVELALIGAYTRKVKKP